MKRSFKHFSSTILYVDSRYFRHFCFPSSKNCLRLRCIFGGLQERSFFGTPVALTEEKSIMTGSFVVKLIAVLLSVLFLSAATFSAAEISFPDDSSQSYQDEAGSLALVGYQVLLLLCKAGTYLSCEEQETFHQPLTIFRHTYRGPPILF